MDTAVVCKCDNESFGFAVHSSVLAVTSPLLSSALCVAALQPNLHISWSSQLSADDPSCDLDCEHDELSGNFDVRHENNNETPGNSHTKESFGFSNTVTTRTSSEVLFTVCYKDGEYELTITGISIDVATALINIFYNEEWEISRGNVLFLLLLVQYLKCPFLDMIKYQCCQHSQTLSPTICVHDVLNDDSLRFLASIFVENDAETAVYENIFDYQYSVLTCLELKVSINLCTYSALTIGSLVTVLSQNLNFWSLKANNEKASILELSWSLKNISIESQGTKVFFCCNNLILTLTIFPGIKFLIEGLTNVHGKFSAHVGEREKKKALYFKLVLLYLCNDSNITRSWMEIIDLGCSKINSRISSYINGPNCSTTLPITVQAETSKLNARTMQSSSTRTTDVAIPTRFLLEDSVVRKSYHRRRGGSDKLSNATGQLHENDRTDVNFEGKSEGSRGASIKELTKMVLGRMKTRKNKNSSFGRRRYPYDVSEKRETPNYNTEMTKMSKTVSSGDGSAALIISKTKSSQDSSDMVGVQSASIDDEPSLTSALVECKRQVDSSQDDTSNVGSPSADNFSGLSLRKCPGCSLRFVTAQSCLVHMQQQHLSGISKSFGVACVDPNCPVLVKVNNEVTHLLRHIIPSEHNCHFCSFSCSTRGGLSRHHLIHQVSQVADELNFFIPIYLMFLICLLYSHVSRVSRNGV